MVRVVVSWFEIEAVEGDAFGAITGAGALNAQAGDVDGLGISASIGSGSAAAGAATLAGAGISASIGSGALAAAASDADGAGDVTTIGPTVRVLVSWFELEGVEGAAIATGDGSLVAGAASISGAGEVTGEVAPPVDGGGGFYPYSQQRRPDPVEGHGYGILPRIVGEAHGVVIAAGRSVGVVRCVGQADASAGVAGRSTARLTVKATAAGVAGTRGKGSGMIVKFKGAANGGHDDDDAIVAWLLAA